MPDFAMAGHSAALHVRGYPRLAVNCLQKPCSAGDKWRMKRYYYHSASSRETIARLRPRRILSVYSALLRGLAAENPRELRWQSPDYQVLASQNYSLSHKPVIGQCSIWQSSASLVFYTLYREHPRDIRRAIST